jgi:hypothetical protein
MYAMQRKLVPSICYRSKQCVMDGKNLKCLSNLFTETTLPPTDISLGDLSLTSLA